MGLIQFTRNYDDLSTDKGYQFRFYCDKCGNGYLTSFKASTLGMAGGLLSAAGNLFGGFLGSAGESAYQVQRAVGGKAHDDALQEAVTEAKPNFRQCTRCGKWVCPQQCWNAKRNLCEECAPDEAEEMAAAQAQATRDQIWEKARSTDYVQKLDMNAPASVFCQQCGAKSTGGKFCKQCGFKFAQARPVCSSCGHQEEAGAKFCGECGSSMA